MRTTYLTVQYKEKNTMKKLFIAIMLVGLSAIAAQTYQMKKGVYENAFPVLQPTQFSPEQTIYGASSNKLTYTVTDNINRRYLALYYDKATKTYYTAENPVRTAYELAHLHFTANKDFNITLFTDIDDVPTSELRVDSKLNITDYGIYLYNDNDPSKGIGESISLYNGYYAIKEGQNFGVYYTADTEYYVRDAKYDPETYGIEVVRENTNGVTYTTDANWVASYDGFSEGNHIVAASEAWYSDTEMRADDAILCMFQGPFKYGESAFLEWQHVEFGFAEYYKEPEPPTGQPLPGAFATLIISGICAMSLRKKK